MQPEINLPTPYQQYIHQSRYARWDDAKNRRETWSETVSRYVDFWKNKFNSTFPHEAAFNDIANLHVMPSMRALMTAGPALERDQIAGFNCSFVAVDDIRAFDEIVYVLMCGTGVGFTVEDRYTQKLPSIPKQLYKVDHVIHVEDSKQGWASAYRELISCLYKGVTPSWDVSQVRPKGARLKTFGGRASGPEPLVELFKYTIDKFTKARGRQLTSLECHDLVCKIADIVVVGGVRRSALISLSDLTNTEMSRAKIGTFDPVRYLANNSAVYAERPSPEVWMREMAALYESHAGERGLFNLHAAHRKAKESGRRFAELIAGTNPCAEILLRSCGLCNLTEVIIRAGDSLATLLKKVRMATILGTFQATLTDFQYVRDVWKKNQEEERLLGVSLTGIMDHEVLSKTSDEAIRWLKAMKECAIETNKHWANKLGIPVAAAITCVKPSGTVSQLVNCSSGIHAAHAPYYLRTVRGDNKDPLAKMMKDQGFYCEPAVGKEDSTDVFYFPQKSTATIFRNDRTAVQQLEHYLMFQRHWSEHNVSNTIYYSQDEFIEVTQWMYKNFDELSGVSLLPTSDHVYVQAPYIDIDESEYQEWMKKSKDIDWSKLKNYETTDATVNTKELACTAGGCEIV